MVKIVTNKKFIEERELHFSFSTPNLKEAKDYASLMQNHGHHIVVILKTKNIKSPFHPKLNPYRYGVFRDKY